MTVLAPEDGAEEAADDVHDTGHEGGPGCVEAWVAEESERDYSHLVLRERNCTTSRDD